MTRQPSNTRFSLRGILAVAVVTAIVAVPAAGCGGGSDEAGTSASEQNLTTTVPREAGDANATKAPNADALGHLQEPSSEAAALPNFKGSDAPLEEFLATLGNRAATYWQRVFNRVGFKMDPNTQVVVISSADTKCGQVTTSDPPRYCVDGDTVYLPVGFVREKAVPLGDGAVVAVVALIYGYRVSDLFGLQERVGLGLLKARDYNLLSMCFAGAWAHNLNQKRLFEGGDLSEILDFAKATAEAPGTPATDPNAQGTKKQRKQAFAEGLKGGAKACGL